MSGNETLQITPGISEEEEVEDDTDSAGAEKPGTGPLVPGWGWQHQQPRVNYF